MGKKQSTIMRKKSLVHKKGTRHYLCIYFLAVFTGVIVSLTASFLYASDPTCANSHTCKSDLRYQIDNNILGYFQGHNVNPPKIYPEQDTIIPSVLGINDPVGEKHIYVDLATQKLYAYQGTTEFMQTFISSGRWGKTPVGNFSIWTKLRATRMSGGSGSDYYDLPNVPYTMYFYNDFGLHGAYWHNNFGHKMSHGCVNMRIVDARDLFNWANVGTPVSVCNQFIAPDTCNQ
jgi:lipoprotein-anchoring transpeptidase ErfK/SrfK